MLLTLPEAAALLRCSIYTLRRRIRAREIATVSFGPRSNRIDHDTLKAYIRAREVPVSAPSAAAPAVAAPRA